MFSKKKAESTTPETDQVEETWQPIDTAIAAVTSAVITISLTVGAMALMDFVDKKLSKYIRNY